MLKHLGLSNFYEYICVSFNFGKFSILSKTVSIRECKNVSVRECLLYVTKKSLYKNILLEFYIEFYIDYKKIKNNSVYPILMCVSCVSFAFGCFDWTPNPCQYCISCLTDIVDKQLVYLINVCGKSAGNNSFDHLTRK